MARINTNVSALIANTNLATNQTSLNQSIQRLSSGLRINSGADDPAGLIVSEQLQAEIQGISAGINNSTQAQNVISTADAALGEVSNLLVSIKGLVVQAANSGAVTARGRGFSARAARNAPSLASGFFLTIATLPRMTLV